VWCDSVGCIAGVVCFSPVPNVSSCFLYSTINILLCHLPNIHLNYHSTIYYNFLLIFRLYSCSMGVRYECELCAMYLVKMEDYNKNKINSTRVGVDGAGGGGKSVENGRK